MNQYTQKYQTRVNELIKKNFPELENFKIKVYEFNLGKYYSGMALYLPFFKIILLGRKIRKYNNKAVKGILAHELCHFEQFSKFNWFKLLIYFFKYDVLRQQSFMIKVEKETDLLTIKKGYGKELLASIIERKKYSKNNKKAKLIRTRYFSENEIKSYMKKLK